MTATTTKSGVADYSKAQQQADSLAADVAEIDQEIADAQAAGDAAKVAELQKEKASLTGGQQIKGKKITDPHTIAANAALKKQTDALGAAGELAPKQPGGFKMPGDKGAATPQKQGFKAPGDPGFTRAGSGKVSQAAYSQHFKDMENLINDPETSPADKKALQAQLEKDKAQSQSSQAQAQPQAAQTQTQKAPVDTKAGGENKNLSPPGPDGLQTLKTSTKLPQGYTIKYDPKKGNYIGVRPDGKGFIRSKKATRVIQKVLKHGKTQAPA